MTRLLAATCALALLAACSKKEEAPAPTPGSAGATKPAAPAVPPPADVAAPPPTAQKFPNGIAMEVVKPGTGSTKPTDADIATVNYSIWRTDGTLIDSTLRHGKPAPIPVGRVPPGVGFCLEQMTEGETARFWIPDDPALKGHSGGHGTQVVQFDLISIKKGEPPVPAPPDVKAPPADAEKLPSGVAIKVLTPGTGTVHPKLTDKIEVAYTGWTTDGKMFDSSRDRTVTFPLGNLISGWQEGLQHMVEGEKARMWIPEELAYKGKPGAPQGMLVFDITLVKIQTPPSK